MFIAHFPAGYLLASASEARLDADYRRLAFWCILIGSVAPDLDMFYFNFLTLFFVAYCELN